MVRCSILDFGRNFGQWEVKNAVSNASRTLNRDDLNDAERGISAACVRLKNFQC
jgi:hypothetical protein